MEFFVRSLDTLTNLRQRGKALLWALVRTISDRKRPTLLLIGDENRSYWYEWRYPDGRATTQFCFWLEATNLTNTPIRLSAARLMRPRTWTPLTESDVLTRSPDYPRDTRYSHENSILPYDTARVMSTLAFDKRIAGPGRRLETTLKMSDQFGRWHKVRFKLDRWPR
jgi:hypothetical protein